jgi:hypothetical protein
MPAFDRLSPNFIKNFLGRIKHPRNFLPANVAESDGILSVLRPFNEGECRKDGEDGFYNKGFRASSLNPHHLSCYKSEIFSFLDFLSVPAVKTFIRSYQRSSLGPQGVSLPMPPSPAWNTPGNAK